MVLFIFWGEGSQVFVCLGSRKIILQISLSWVDLDVQRGRLIVSATI